MTPQEVIKAFMARLNIHGYSVSNATATNMLDSAILASSRYTGIQEVIDAMKADQATCEKAAIQTVVTEVLGADWYNANCFKDATKENGDVLKDENGNTIRVVMSLSEIEETLNAVTTDKDGNAISKSTFSSYIEQDYHNFADVIREVTAHNFLKDYCGIQLNNKSGFTSSGTVAFYSNVCTTNTDTGAITGSDAGGETTKTADSVVPEDTNKTFSIDNLQTDDDGYLYFETNGLKVRIVGERDGETITKITAANFSEIEGNETTKYQAVIIAALYKWWVEQALILNEDSYNIGFETDGVTVKQIDVYFENKTTSTLAYVANVARNGSDGEAYHLDLVINTKYYSDITSYDDVNGVGTKTGDGAGYLDRTLAHEFTHAIMAANINYFNKLPKFIKEGMAELTHGIDDERGNTIFKIAYDAEQLAGSLDLTNSGTGSQEVGDGYAGGYMFLRYFVKQAAAQTATLPALGEFTATVNFNNLTVVEGSILAINVSNNEKNPAVEVLTQAELAEKLTTHLVIGAIYADQDNDLYYEVSGDLVKQNITLGNNVCQVYKTNANTNVTGSDQIDGIQIIEGSTEVNTGGGDDIVQITGQYATVNTGADNDQVYILEGEHNNINLGDGTNYLELTTNRNIATGGNGTDIIAVGGNENTIYTGGGNDTLLFGAFDTSFEPTSYYARNANTIDLGDGNDKLTFAGADNYIICGKGSDYIIELYSDQIERIGYNSFIFNDYFDDNTIQGFLTTDTIHIATAYNYTLSERITNNYSDGTTYDTFTITVTDEQNNTKGTIAITQDEGQTFDAATNIVADLAEIPEFNVIDVTESGQTVQLTEGVDIIYIKASVATDWSAGGGTITLKGGFKDGDKIILYKDNKDDSKEVFTSFSNGINVNDNVATLWINGNDMIKLVGGFDTKTTWGALENNSATCNVNIFAPAKDNTETQAVFTYQEVETENFTITGINSTDGITVDGYKIYVPKENIVGTAEISSSSNQFKFAVEEDNRAEITMPTEFTTENNTASYTATVTKAGLHLLNGNKKITYVEAGNLDLVKLSGIEDASKLSFESVGDYSNNVIVINSDAVGNNKKVKAVSNFGNYYLKLAEGVSDITFNATGGDDFITNYGSNVTISGGAGNDTFFFESGENVTFKYKPGDGNDTIYHFNTYQDKIIIVGDEDEITPTVTTSTNEYSVPVVTIKIDKDNIITLQDLIGDFDTETQIKVVSFPYTLDEDDDGAYLISSADDLQELATYVSGGNTCEGLTFKLGDNVTVTEDCDLSTFAGTISGTVTIATGKTFTLPNKTIRVESGSITFDIDTSTFGGLDTGDKFNVGSDSYEVLEDGRITKTVDGQTYIHSAATSFNLSDENWTLYSGTATVEYGKPLTIGDNTLTILKDYYAPVTATVENGVLKSVSRAQTPNNTEFTYNGKNLWLSNAAVEATFDDSGDLTSISGENGASFSYNGGKSLTTSGEFSATYDNGNWSVTTGANITVNNYTLEIDSTAKDAEGNAIPASVTANYNSSGMLQTVSGIGAGVSVRNLKNGTGTPQLTVNKGTISATYSTDLGGSWDSFGNLDTGEEFTYQGYNYKVKANGVLSYYLGEVKNFYAISDGTANFANYQYARLVSTGTINGVENSKYISPEPVDMVFVEEETAAIVAEMKDNTLTPAAGYTVPENFYVNVDYLGSGTISKDFKKIGYNENYFTVEASDNYSFTKNGNLYLNPANITKVTASGGEEYTFDNGVAKKKSGDTTYAQNATNGLAMNELTSYATNWGLYNGDAYNVTSLKIYDDGTGKTLTATGGTVNATVTEGKLESAAITTERGGTATVTYGDGKSVQLSAADGIMAAVYVIYDTSGNVSRINSIDAGETVTYNGKTLTVSSGYIDATFDSEGNLTAVIDLDKGAAVTYGDKTYSHTINLPSGVTATGDTLTAEEYSSGTYPQLISSKTYYADGSTITITNFGAGKEITFAEDVTFTKDATDASGKTVTATFTNDKALTLNFSDLDTTTAAANYTEGTDDDDKTIYTYTNAKTAAQLNLDDANDKIGYIPATGGVPVFTISGVNTGKTLDLPTVDGEGKYNITLPDYAYYDSTKNISITKLDDSVIDAAINAKNIPYNSNITVDFDAKITVSNGVGTATINGKKYSPSTGDSVIDTTATSSTLYSGTVIVSDDTDKTLTTSDGKELTVTDKATVTVADGAVTSIKAVSLDSSVTYNGKTYAVTSGDNLKYISDNTHYYFYDYNNTDILNLGTSIDVAVGAGNVIDLTGVGDTAVFVDADNNVVATYNSTFGSYTNHLKITDDNTYTVKTSSAVTFNSNNIYTAASGVLEITATKSTSWLVSGAATVTDNGKYLKLADGKELRATSGTVTANVADGVLQTVSSTDAATFNYNGKALTTSGEFTATYDSDGILQTVSSTDAATFTYNEKTLQATGAFTANYDGDGNLQTVSITDSTSPTVTYDDKALVISNCENPVVTYDANGKLASVSVKGTGTVAELTYNNGNTLQINADGTDENGNYIPPEVTVNYENDALKSVSGLGANEYVTYNGKTLKVTSGEISVTLDAEGNFATFGDLNEGDQFNIKNSSGLVESEYTVYENSIIKTTDSGSKKFVHSLATSVNQSDGWTAAEEVNNNTIYLAKNTAYIDNGTKEIIAQIDSDGKFTVVPTNAADYDISFSEDGTFTIPAEFTKFGTGTITATENYALTVTNRVMTINVTNVTQVTDSAAAIYNTYAPNLIDSIAYLEEYIKTATGEDLTAAQGYLADYQAQLAELEPLKTYPDSVITFDANKTVATNTEGNNIWKQNITNKEISADQLCTTAIQQNNWALESGEVTVTGELKTTDGNTLTVTGDGAKVTATVANGALTNISGIDAGETVTYNDETLNATSGEISATFDNGKVKTVSSTGAATFTYNEKTLQATGAFTANYDGGNLESVSGLSAGAVVTYDGKTYSHTITLPSGVTASGDDTLTIDGVTYYADGSTVAITNFGADKEITFDGAITSLEVSGKNVLAKVGNDTSLTISGLSFYSTTEKSWSVSGTSASYGTEIHNGAKIDGAKIIYQPDDFDATFTLENLAADITIDKIKAAVEVDGTAIKIKSDTVLDKTKTVDAPSGYTLAVEGDFIIKPAAAEWNQDKSDATKFIYTVAGDSAGYTAAENKISYVEDLRPTFTLTNFKDGVTLDDIKAAIDVDDTTITIKDAEILAQDKIITAPSGYTLKLGGDIVPSEEKIANGEMAGEIFSYISAGNTAGYRVVDGTIKYFTDDRKTFTISGLDTDAELGKNISVSGDKITISKDALAQDNATLTTSDNFTMEFDGVSAATLTGENWSGLNYQTEYYSVEGWEIDGNNINYTGTTTPKTLFSLSGVESNSGFTVSKDGTAYTVKVADSAVANLTEETTVTLANVDSKITANFAFDSEFTGEKTLTQNAAATLSGGKYTSKTYKAYSEIDGATLTFHPATTAKEFTITNLSDAAKLGENVEVTDGETTNFKFYANALDKKSVTISGGTFSVELDTGVDTTADTISENFNLSNGTLNYTAAGVGEFYTKTASGVTYTGQSHGETFILTGIKSADGVSVSGGTVTLSESAVDLNSNSEYQIALTQNNSDISNAVNFELQFSGVNTSAQTVQPALTKSSTDYIYRSSYTAAYFDGSGNTYNFVPAESYDEIKIGGLKTSGDLTVSENENATADVIVANGKVIVNSTALSDSHGKISIDKANYSLELTGGTVEPIEFNSQENNDHYEITLSGTSAGYIKSGNEYIWQNQIQGEEITISGLKSGAVVTAEMFSRDANGGIIFTPTDEILPENPTTITISSGVIDTSSLTTTDAVKAHWDEFAYIGDKTASSWTTGAATVTFTPATGGEVLTEISGVKNTAGLSVSGKVVTVANSSLDESTVTVTNGYTLKLAKDVTKTSTNQEGWYISENTANYKTTEIFAGYSLANDSKSISYINASGGETLITISGIKNSAKAKDISLDGTSVSVDASVVNKGEVSISDGYSLILEKGTYKGVSVVGGEDSDTITQNGNQAVINTGADDDIISLGSGASNNTIIGGAGDDSIFAKNGKNYYSYTSGDGNDTITGWNKNDTLKINGGEIESWNVDEKDLTLNIGNGSIKILDGVGASITSADANNKTVTKIYDAGAVYDAKKTSVTLTSDVDEIYTEKTSSVVSINGAAANSVEIIGNAKSNSILGGKGNDTLNGGAGNDTLTGGNGKDVFVYNAGKDVITDYTEDDEISIASNNITASVKGNDVIFNKNLTVKNAVGKKVTVNDEVKIYEVGKIYNEDKTEVTFISAFKGTVENGVETIYGADVASSIVGNDSDNLIVGGTKADTLNGGKGDDTLTGDDGKDIFVYESGEDVITDYTEIDKISFKAEITNSYVNENDVIFETENGTVTVKDGVGKKITTLNAKNKETVQIYYDGYILNQKQTAATLTSYFSASSYTAANTVLTIDGSAANSVEIIGNAKNNSILGSNGDDTLWGNSGNDTLFGGEGADVFIYNTGKDVIADYTEEDQISISSENITASVKGNDVIFNKNLTVKNAAGKKVTVNDEVKIYEVGKIYNEDKTELTLISAFKGTVENSVENIYGANATSSILGNDSDNLIVGGTKADTLNGGAGDDTLTGGNGNDLFVYESGNDVITDYTAKKDKIKISSDTISNYYFDGADVIFNTSKGSITVQNAKDKKITLLDSKNKTSYWFDGSPNFIKDGTQISSLMRVADTNYSVSDTFDNNDNATELAKDDSTKITFKK